MESWTKQQLLQMRLEYKEWADTQVLAEDSLLRKFSEERYGKNANNLQFIAIAFSAHQLLCDLLINESELAEERRNVEHDC